MFNSLLQRKTARRLIGSFCRDARNSHVPKALINGGGSKITDFMLETLDHWIPRRSLVVFRRAATAAPNRGNCMRQAPEQRGMAAMTDATIVSRAAASKSARRDNDRVIETSIPSRLDSLRWSGFHTRVVAALGITWILDGLEVTLAGALSGALKESPTMHFTNFEVGFANSAYLAGAVLGALWFGWLTDRIGRTNCSSSRWRFISQLPPRPRCRGGSRATHSFDFLPEPASAVNTRRSIPRSRNWCARSADGLTL